MQVLFAVMCHQKNTSAAVLSLGFLQGHGLDSRKCLTVFCLSYGDTVNSAAELSFEEVPEAHINNDKIAKLCTVFH